MLTDHADMRIVNTWKRDACGRFSPAPRAIPSGSDSHVPRQLYPVGRTVDRSRVCGVPCSAVHGPHEVVRWCPLCVG